MSKCLLIGFSYGEGNFNEDDVRINLPGIIIDLYLAYKKVKSINPLEICIITDISRNIQTELLTAAIFEGTVKSDILNFIDTIKKEGIYHPYSGRSDFIKKLTDFSSNTSHYFTYYTGHYDNGRVVLPTHNKDICYTDDSNNSYLDGTIFRNLIVNKSNPNCEHLFIMDCCNFDGFGLIYSSFPRSINHRKSYKSYTSVREEQNKYILDPNIQSRFYVTKEIICISSSSINLKSIATNKGSLFSKIFFKVISDISSSDGTVKRKSRNLLSLCRDINDKLSTYNKTQKVTVYVSCPFVKILPRWFIDGIIISIEATANFIILKK